MVDAAEPLEPVKEEEEPSRDALEKPMAPLLQACIDMGMAHYPSFASVPEHLQRKVRRSLFPPTAEEAQWMHLGKSDSS